MLDCLKRTSSGTYELMKKKFADVLQTLETNETVKTIYKELESYCLEIVAIGFNSGTYDLNSIKQTPVQQMLDMTDFVIRKINSYVLYVSEKQN